MMKVWWISLAIGTVVMLLMVLAVAIQVEDWSRDLSTNVAEADGNAKDICQRPIRAQNPPKEVIAAVKEAVAELPNWEWIDIDTQGNTTHITLVRTSTLFRFKDDVVVKVEGTTQSMVYATSRSRVGKGDLGQNPRNIRTLFGAVRKKLGLPVTAPASKSPTDKTTPTGRTCPRRSRFS